LPIKKKVAYLAMFTLLLLGMLSLAFNIKSVKGEWTGTVYIRADGSIEPSDAPIFTIEKVIYTLTDNITSSANGIIVERDNIIIDGVGFALQGTIMAMEVGKGISISFRNNVTIRNMLIQGFSIGIYINSCSNIQIVENKVEHNCWGIFLKDTPFTHTYHNNNLKNNEVCKNNYGIKLYNSSCDVMEGNNISLNRWHGLLLESSSYNRIMRNNVTLNEYGIELQRSSNNLIHSNNFISNVVQAKADGFDNIWCEPYPYGGNYWSDYTGVDERRGPHQDKLGSDGIGDTPYIIDYNNRDAYPLMIPCPFTKQPQLKIVEVHANCTRIFVGDRFRVKVVVKNTGNVRLYVWPAVEGSFNPEDSVKYIPIEYPGDWIDIVSNIIILDPQQSAYVWEDPFLGSYEAQKSGIIYYSVAVEWGYELDENGVPIINQETSETLPFTIYSQQTYTLHIQSSPITGVHIGYTGDYLGGDSTNFDIGPKESPFTVLLTAPQIYQDYRFDHWELDGVNMGSDTALTVSVNDMKRERTAVAVYFSPGVGPSYTVNYLFSSMDVESNGVLHVYFQVLKHEADGTVTPANGVPVKIQTSLGSMEKNFRKLFEC
jgi:parallel beta-helix repeat protein